MKRYPLCQPYIWENPKVLLETGFTWKGHKEGPCASEIINQILFVYLFAFALGAAMTVVFGQSYGMFILMGVATVYCFPSFLALIQIRSGVEGFQTAPQAQAQAAIAPSSQGGLADVPGGVYHVIGGAPTTSTLPTARNPFMNVLIDEIKYNPQRPVAASILDPSVKVTLDDFFRTQFTADPTDVFGRSQSQRQFITMPSTGIPNDQESYQNWLYKIPGKTCKEGGREACLPGTDGGALPWMNSNP